MITRLRYPKGYQFFDANGAPLAVGNLYYYVAGTTTPQDTYSDSAGTVTNTNPIVLDGSGRLDVDVYLGSSANYKEVLTTASATVAPWPDDNIPLASQADWNATSGPNQILNKPVLAAVATSGSYTDLSNTPSTNAPFTGDSGSGGTSGLVPAPAAGDAVANMFLSAAGGWATPPGSSSSSATNLSMTQTASSVGIGSSSGTGITVPAATSAAAGVLDSARAAKIDGLAMVATSGSYSDLTNKPSIPAIPGALAGQNIDNVARLGINTTDTGNLLSVNAPSVLFSSAGDMRTTISKGASSNTAALNFQDNFNTRAQFGLLGNDNFTISTSPDGTTFNSAIVASPAGAVTFPNTGGFAGDSGSGGASGLVPAPAAGSAASGMFLKADGTWSVPPGASSPMTGATSSSSGTAGLVPAPAAGQQGSFLRGDGTWQQVTAAQVSGLSPSATVDATDASNIASGTLAAARVGDLSGTYLTVASAGANSGIATLDSGGKLTASQIPASLVGAAVYQGTWNASTNTPMLASGVGTKGNYYKVSVAGTTAIDGNAQWNIGDTIIFDGTAWDKIDGNSPEVLSVAGLYGSITGAALKGALAISASDVSGLGALATQATVNLATQAVSGSYSVALNATGNSSLTLPASGTLLSGLNNQTYNIYHAGGGDFTDLNAAFTYLTKNLPIAGATINLDAGTHNYSVPVYVGFNWLKDVLIQGAAPVNVNLTSIASASGSAGNWAIVLNVSSTAGISVGNYAAIYGASGGTNPTYIEGIWPITAIGSGQITISTTHRNAAPPSGAVNASIAAMGTILKFTGCDGFDIWDGASAIQMSNLVIAGDGSAGHYGISLQDLGRINAGGIVGVSGFGGYNVYINLNSEFNSAGYLISSGSGSYGIYTDTGSVLDVAGEIVASGNATKGLFADAGSYVRGWGNSGAAQGITASGNGSDGSYVSGRAVVDPYALGYGTGNGGYGWHSDAGGRFLRNISADGNNASGGFSLAAYSAPGTSTTGFNLSHAAASSPVTVEATNGSAVKLQTPSTSQSVDLDFAESAGAIRWRVQKDSSNNLQFQTATGAQGSEAFSQQLVLYANGNLTLVNGTIVAGANISSSGGYVQAQTKYYVGTNQVIGPRVTGWSAPTGTLSRGTFAAYAGQTQGASYSQTSIQTLDNAVASVSQTLAALITDLRSHGLINT